MSGIELRGLPFIFGGRVQCLYYFVARFARTRRMTMVDMSHPARLEEAARIWKESNIRDLLTKSAIAVGAGSATDAGLPWALPTNDFKPIELAGGIPDPAQLPVDDLKESFRRVLESTPKEALRYGGVPGFEGLREALAERQSRLEGFRLEPGNFIINNGGAGGIDNVCDAFVEPGDVVIVEAPTFSGSLRTIRGHMPEIVPVPVDDDGVLVERVADELSRVEEAGKRAKLVYIIPDFHNPTGTTLSMERRERLIEACAAHKVLILEDTAYGEMYFGKEAPPSIYAMAQGQGILKAATFSKIIATGLRIGWVQGREDYVESLVRVRFDMGNSPLLQRAIADYMERGKLDPHVEEMRSVYAEKCDVLCRSLEEHCQPYLRFKKPEGGFFLWAECQGPSAKDLAKAATDEGLIFPIGANFFIDGESNDTSHIRLAFITATLEDLEQVGPRMRKAFQRALGER